MGKTHNIVGWDRTTVKTNHVMFLEKYEQPMEQIKVAITTICDFKRETVSIKAAHDIVIMAWTDARKQWELELVFRAWDQRTAKFPLYVTLRDNLGDKEIAIPVEWVERLSYQLVPYCGHCLKPMDPFYTPCWKDIDTFHLKTTYMCYNLQLY